MIRAIRMIVSLPGLALIGFVRLYQIFLSPWIGQNCRFTPTCSAYMIQAINKYGVIRGVWKGLWRLTRCHPWHPGGNDQP